MDQDMPGAAAPGELPGESPPWGGYAYSQLLLVYGGYGRRGVHAHSS